MSEPQIIRANHERPLLLQLLLPSIACVLGLGLITLTAELERRWVETAVWPDAILSLSGEPPWDGAIPVSVRDVPLDSVLAELPTFALLVTTMRARPGGEEAIDTYKLDFTERFVMLDLPETEWQRLLVSGRPPAAGKPEVVAGELTRMDRFEIDGTTFEVVGRLRRDVAALPFAYVLKEDPSMARFFAADAGATQGWLDPKGRERLESMDIAEAIDPDTTLVGFQMRTEPLYTIMTIAGLAMTIGGWLFIQRRLMLHFGERGVPLLAALARPLRNYRRSFWLVHAVCYAALFSALMLGLAMPTAQFFLQQFVRDTFAEGPLQFVHTAYAEQDILLAALMTFLFNYLVATVALTILVSLVVPYIGWLKTCLTMLVVGFAMSPLMTGEAAEWRYHAVTGALELEQYVIASWLVVIYPFLLYRAFRAADWPHSLWHVARVMGSGTVVIGIMLALAAFYEAVTIILFRG